ncbi:MAG: type II toxin-antitoxin system RelE/ParE family toxin [Gammaproteobacteria bacterium]|nr:type II toxin-antitoxin system RelE/ParE family toxin [Gammaproteobacteria bacterium]MBU2005756.1 type II toxin-antitoxin system RelE/ParE family toxin [Gammaproteobacteria bacterium]
MLDLRIRPQAESDIDEIITWLLENNPAEATRFVMELRDTFELLAENPLIGATRQYRLPALRGIRMFPLKKYSAYLIFYLNSQDTLEIVRVLHGRRDLQGLFNDSDESAG